MGLPVQSQPSTLLSFTQSHSFTESHIYWELQGCRGCPAALSPAPWHSPMSRPHGTAQWDRAPGAPAEALAHRDTPAITV